MKGQVAATAVDASRIEGAPPESASFGTPPCPLSAYTSDLPSKTPWPEAPTSHAPRQLARVACAITAASSRGTPDGPPTSFGKYRLIEPLGAGAFGEVRTAVHASLDSPEALPTCL